MNLRACMVCICLSLGLHQAGWAVPVETSEAPTASSANGPMAFVQGVTGLGQQLGQQIVQGLGQARDRVGHQATDLVDQAMTLLGVPYQRGGQSSESGFDCSGFVRYVYEQSFGRLLPRRADEQAKQTEKIDRSELQPGDLVFFNTMRRTFSHVGVYIGDGKFIHAPSVGKNVRVDDMRDAYWKKRFTGARRVNEPRS